MKQLNSTLLALLLFSSAFATTDSATVTGLWNSDGTWHLGRVPVHNDTIVIKEGVTVTMTAVTNDLNNVVIKIYGTLVFNNAKLRLDRTTPTVTSRVIVESDGTITGGGSNDQLSIGGVLKFSGSNDVTINGYTYADNSTGSSNSSIPGSGFLSVLPVTFQSFYVARQAGNIQLSWATSAEVNNGYFAIERSTDGLVWKQVAMVIGAGTTALVSRYSYTDKNISDAIVYYRIRQVATNGSSQYSAIRMLRNNGNTAIANIYTSSAQTITVDFNSDVKTNVIVQVINTNGQIIARHEYKQASYRLSFNVAAGGGIYVVRVSDGTGWSEVKKVALQMF